MSEVRFSIDDLTEKKIAILMKKMKMKTRREFFVYLLNNQYQKSMEAEK